MLVEIVTAPSAPASATTAASSVSLRALSTRQSTPASRKSAASRSDSWTLTVPTSTGRPLAWTREISATRTRRFPSWERWITSG
jgi:hypothetical protein